MFQVFLMPAFLQDFPGSFTSRLILPLEMVGLLDKIWKDRSGSFRIVQDRSGSTRIYQDSEQRITLKS